MPVWFWNSPTLPVHAFQIPLALELPTEQGQGLQHAPGWLRIKFFAVDSLRCSTSLCRGFCLVRAFNVAVGHPIISCLSPSSPTSTYVPFNPLQLVYVNPSTTSSHTALLLAALSGSWIQQRRTQAVFVSGPSPHPQRSPCKHWWQDLVRCTRKGEPCAAMYLFGNLLVYK